MKLITAIITIAALAILTGGSAQAQRTGLPVPQCYSQPTDLFNGLNHTTITLAPSDTSCPWSRGTVIGGINFTTDDCWYVYDPSWSTCYVTCETPVLDITLQYSDMGNFGFGSEPVWNISTYYLNSPSIYGEPYCWEDARMMVYP